MNSETLRGLDILEGLDDAQRTKLATITREHTCRAGDYLFLLGDAADRIYAVVSGRVDLCVPVTLPDGSVEDIRFDTRSAGQALGWSALVSPYRFTLSARAKEATELVAFTRQDLLRLFYGNPAIARIVMAHVAELVGQRLEKMQALWVRSLQRDLLNGLAPHDNRETGSSRDF